MIKLDLKRSKSNANLKANLDSKIGW